MKVSDVIALFEQHGDSQYGGEAVTQLEHALQCAALAAEEQAPDSLVAAALLHDVGHLLHDLPDDAPDRGIDDVHEAAGRKWLRSLFPREVTQPVALHVAAKRYLCAVDPDYLAQLSAPSVQSLALQGGAMSAEEVERFRDDPFSEAAVRLRRWDDKAKISGLDVPPISHYRNLLDSLARSESDV
jgi:phosphonate degradation associated HDIG domain protein